MRNGMKYLVFGNGKSIEKKCVFWNMLFSILTSLQSAVMLLIVTRVNGTEDAGILSIAFATAYLMYTIGTYGVRNFQVTDASRQYSYSDYRRVRIISSIMMIVVSLFYCVWKHYDSYKASVVLVVCTLKLLESVEDLYHGELQREGRLDVAGRAGMIRLIGSYAVFIIVLLLSSNLFIALCASVMSSLLCIIIMRPMVGELFAEDVKNDKWQRFIELSAACFPLFITAFLSIYICNSPKYAIDNCLTEKDQAYYAIISMPVFTINLLSGVIYRPKLFHMAKMWAEENKTMFTKMIMKQTRNIAVISGLILFFGLTVGLKLLEILYGVSLDSLKLEFAVLLLGGGVVAIYNFLTACITIMRKQTFLIGLSVFIMVLSWIISDKMVQYAGLTGAAWLYFILMACEMVIVLIALFGYLRKANNANCMMEKR